MQELRAIRRRMSLDIVGMNLDELKAYLKARRQLGKSTVKPKSG